MVLSATARKKKKVKIFIVVIGIILLLIVIGKMILFPKYEEIGVTGKYSIKSEDYWVTEEKPDPYLNDGSMREVQVRAWYPENYDENDEKLPVVIASHGSCGSIDNNLSLYKELSSHGFVVLAVAHPGHASETIHSNGKKQSVSMDYMKEMGTMDPQAKLEETAKTFESWMELRMTDLDYVMNDSVTRAIDKKEIFKSADTSRFIAIGHSAGGTTAYGMARTRDDVIGVISLEAPCMYDIKGVENNEYIIDDSDYNIPVLSIYSDSSYPHLREWKQYSNNVKFFDSENENYHNIYYEGTGHMSLCDLSLASPVFASILDQKKSEVPAREQLKRINEDCIEFVESCIIKK